MEYRKETHFIVAYEGNKMKGKWDILTNQFIGVKGAIIKSKPQSFNNSYLYAMNDVFKSALTAINYFDNYHPYTPAHGQRFEEIISVGLKIDANYHTCWHLLDNTAKLTKDCVDFIKQNYNGIYSRNAIDSYLHFKKYKNVLDKCGEQKEWALYQLKRINDEIPQDFVEGMMLRAIHEKIFFDEYPYGYNDEFAEIVNEWYAMVTTMGDKLEVKHNILSNYRILKWIYNEYKNAHYDETLSKHNNLPCLYYEYGNYIVKPLITRTEFHEEAEAQRNCVERMYMERVANGETHVVVIRKKDSPDIPYITCEVNNAGTIVQYLAKYNHRPQDEMDYQFERIFQDYLHTCEGLG